MTLYEKFKKLDIDFSQFGLEQDSTHNDYFCTPKGAIIIGWEGVDGIHYCFIKGFKEMVFAVNPSNLPGDHIHPLARNFEDFLRLLLACHGLAAAEQAHLWSRDRFDAFLWEDNLPTLERQTALDELKNKLGIIPMDDPYGYIRELQASFDYSKIPYKEDHFHCIPESSKPPTPPWKVYFSHGFSHPYQGHDKPGEEIPIHKTFFGGEQVWHVLAMYVCGKGLVIDLCMEISPAALQTFIEKWQWREDNLSPEEQEQLEAENPMTMDYIPKLMVNGRELRRWSGSGFGWVPTSCRPEEERGKPNQLDWKSLWFMEHYGLNPQQGWMFWRDSFPWATKTKPVVKTVSLSLKGTPTAILGSPFTVSGAGDSVSFFHPVTGEMHILHVVKYEAQEMDTNCLLDKDKWEHQYPTHYTVMSFMVEPNLPQKSLAVRDCGEGDRPRVKQADSVVAASIGIIGGADGPTAITLVSGKREPLWAACSSLYFEPPEQIQWRMVFYQNTVEDIQLDLFPLSLS